MMTVADVVNLMVSGDDSKPARLALLNVLKTPGYPSIIGKMVCEHLYMLTGKSYIYLTGNPFKSEALEKIHRFQTAWAEGNARGEVQHDLIAALPSLSKSTEPLVLKLLPWVVQGYASMLTAKGIDATALRKALGTAPKDRQTP